MDTMKAWLIEPSADGPRLLLGDTPVPSPGAGELLLRVRAVGVNRADLARRTGHYERLAAIGGAPIPGLEAAGEVVAMGAGVSDWHVGDRAMGLPPAAYAEYAVLPAAMALRVPARLSWLEAAALPMAFLTAHNALVTVGGMRDGDHVLLHAAASGVGLAALQIARLRGAASISGTASAAKLAPLAERGLDCGIDYRHDDIAAKTLEASAGHGADVIIDMVGASAAAATLAAAAVSARWVQVGRLGGGKAEIDLDALARKRIALIGVTFRTRSLAEIAALVQAAEAELGPAFESGRIDMPVVQAFAFDAANEAQARLRENGHLGKIVMHGAP